MTDVAGIVNSMRKRGVRLSLYNGQLHYHAPKGTLAPREIATLRESKAEVIDFLAREGLVTPEPRLARRAPSERIPLTFTQQWWWSSHQSSGMNGGMRVCDMRTCSIAIRMIGQLDVGCLRKSINELTRRHESLRTRIIVVDDTLAQEIDQAQICDLEVIDLTAIPRSTVEGDVESIIEKLTRETTGLLFEAKLIRLEGQEHVLVVAMSHMISDTVSMTILLRELGSLYGQSVRGAPFCLPEMPIQYADYAVWQQKTHRWWTDKHAAYWKERFSGATRVKFPSDSGAATDKKIKCLHVPLAFEASLCAGLRELSERAHASFAMSLLTAYVALILRWQGKNDLVVRLLVNGRNRSELESVIGFFASVLHLRIQLNKNDTFLDLLKRVTCECYTAYDHQDFGWVSATWPKSDFALSTGMNWVQTENDINVQHVQSSTVPEDSGNAMRMEPFPFGQHEPDWDSDPNIDPYVTLWAGVNGVSGSLFYQSNLFKPSTMEGLGRNFRLFAEMLLKQPHASVSSLTLR